MEEGCLVRCGWARHLLGEEMQQDAPCEESRLTEVVLYSKQCSAGKPWELALMWKVS